MMRWVFRRIFVPIAGVFMAIVLAFQLIPQERVRRWVAGELGRNLNRQVEIGRLHLGWRGFGVDELRISEIPNFSAGTVLAAKGIRLGWDLRSLWQGLDIKRKWLTRSRGSFFIDDFVHPHYQARQFSLRWSLTEMDPTWSRLNGWARLEQGAGTLVNLDQFAAESPTARMALTPVIALLNLDRLGFLKLGLPDLRRWPIRRILGDYEFKNGQMTLRQFSVDSPQLGIETTGVVQLADGKLDLEVRLHSPERTILGSMDAKIRMTGTTSHPKVDLDTLKKKAFRATLGNLFAKPNATRRDVEDSLKNLFR
jgi:uncharacterized protein YhdP